jgi:GNAT superfamily N-acetyltransferase
MQIRERYSIPCPHGSREPLVYVSFLEVAPWNQAQVKNRRFRGLGQLMLRFACQRSKQLGLSGRIGLHALETAEPFYRKLGFDTPDCPNEYNELYFELSEAKAQLLLSS